MFIRTSETRPRRKKDYDLDGDRERDRDRDRDLDQDNVRRDKDKDKDKEKERERHKSSRKSSSRKLSSSSIRDNERGSSGRDRRPHRSYSGSQPSHRKMAESIPEMSRRSSTASPNNASSSSLAYPSYSKAHSREVVARKSSSSPKLAPYTPDPTNLDGEVPKPSTSPLSDPVVTGVVPPPSPPLTSVEPDLRRAASTNSIRRRTDTEGTYRDLDNASRSYVVPRSARSRSSMRASNIIDDEFNGESRSSTPASRLSEASKKIGSVNDTSTLGPNPSSHHLGDGSTTSFSQKASTVTQSTTDSDATVALGDTYARRTPAPPVAVVTATNSSLVDSSPRTPTVYDSIVDVPTIGKYETPVIDVFAGGAFRPTSAASGFRSASAAGGFRTASAAFPMHNPFANMPPPPPPPPPPMMAASVDPPRVDYLLLNGGLPRVMSRNFLGAANPGNNTVTNPVQLYQQYASPQPAQSLGPSAAAIFAPLQQVLDNYNLVMAKKGSVAVATGYRSVARRLLDRLEAVFARNISSETCHCIICRQMESYSSEEAAGVSWGEILEFVSGRRELPQWPPFSMSSDGPGLGISARTLETPMQKLDIDVPEEYREHYVRQSKKTQKSVQAWLYSQPEMPSSPPQDVDDETLTFAILTYLEPEQRPLFTALLHGMTALPVPRAPTPLNQPKPELLGKTGMALQRLYRLGKLPRDAESTLYLLNNPDLHCMLVTLAAVSAGEWEILVSGRFDGFLWSGADPAMLPSEGTMGGLSRGPTPAPRMTTPFSRGPTPFRTMTPGPAGGGGAPVQMDEETEIAVLAEVEREIFSGMEALEDAFETLHLQAEVVRQNLRERSAGLAMAAQARRGFDHDVEVRLGTPASCLDGLDDDDAPWDDGQSILSLAPDDSASNIGFKRKKRRETRERATPALVEEEDEEVIYVESTPVTKKSGKHRR